MPSEARFLPCREAIMLVLRMNLPPPLRRRGVGKETEYSLSLLGMREIVLLLLAENGLWGNKVSYRTQAWIHAVLETSPCKVEGFVSDASASGPQGRQWERKDWYQMGESKVPWNPQARTGSPVWLSFEHGLFTSLVREGLQP